MVIYLSLPEENLLPYRQFTHFIVLLNDKSCDEKYALRQKRTSRFAIRENLISPWAVEVDKLRTFHIFRTSFKHRAWSV